MRDAWYVGKAKRHCFADKRFWVPLWKLQPILQVIQPIWWFHLSIIYTQFGCINLEQLYSHIGCIKTESSDWLIIIHPYWEYNLNENILAAPTPNMLPHPLNNNKVSFGVVISCWKPGLLKNLIGEVLQAHITIFSVIFKVLRQWKYEKSRKVQKTVAGTLNNMYTIPLSPISVEFTGDVQLKREK